MALQDIHAQAISIEHRVRADQHHLLEAEVELNRAKDELKMLEDSESESEMEVTVVAASSAAWSGRMY